MKIELNEKQKTALAVYNEAVKEFKKNPSAENFSMLNHAMLNYQDLIKN